MRATQGPFYNIHDYGALADGESLCTAAIQKAIDTCAAAGGGTVLAPAGTYVSGAVFLRNNISLELEAGATLKGSPDPGHFPVMEIPMKCADRPARAHASLVSGVSARNISIRGRGTIDAGGAVWWKALKEGTLKVERPSIIGLFDCKDISIQELTLLNSPGWTVHPLYCDNLTIDGLTLRNPPHSPNTDGINPESCRYVRISNCHIDVGDDCITIKSGAGEAARRAARPCEKIAITNCTMIHGHGGVVIGSEMSGDVRDVVISNCVFSETDRGIRLKSCRGRGGVVEDIRVSNIIMERVQCPFVMNLYYFCGAGGHDLLVRDKKAYPVNEETPLFRNIHISHVTARDTLYAAGFIYGLPEQPVENVSFDDVSVRMADTPLAGVPALLDDFPEMCGEGFFCRNTRGLSLRGVEVSACRGPSFMIEDSENIVMDAIGSGSPLVDAPVTRMRNVRDVAIRGCVTRSGTRDFLAVSGADSRNIILSGNQLGSAARRVTDDAPSSELTEQGFKGGNRMITDKTAVCF